MSDIPNEVDAKHAKRDDRPRDPAQWVHRAMQKYRAGRFQLQFRPDDAFFELADAVVVPEHTLLGYDRLYVLWQIVRNVGPVAGDAAEVGSFRGGSAFFVATAFRMIHEQEVTMRVFDTFEGHPEQAITEHDPFHKAGRFRRTSYERVQELLSPFSRVTVHKGDVAESLRHVPDASYRFVHLDTDLYKPTIECLDYFTPRMVSGGVIVVDDFASQKCPGVPKAVAEFMARAGDPFQVWDMRTEQLILVKR